MPAILHDLPFHSTPTSAHLADGSTVAVANHQIIVWVSISPVGLDECPSDAKPFPAVLDTGFNHGFLLQARHFQDWAGRILHPDDFPPCGLLRAYGGHAKLYEADLWLHRNVRGRRDQLLDVEPYRLQLDQGIAISPSSNQPRLPLLGMMAIQTSRLRLFIDGGKQRITLRTPQ